MLFKRHYPSLDFLRSIAITLVLLLHFNLKFYPLPKESYTYHFASWGWNGVGLFFALSGFLIGGQIIEALQAGSFSFKTFYIKRFWRIFPPYYFSLLVVMGFILAGLARPLGSPGDTARTLIYHVFYLQNYLHLPRPPLSLYWSLAVEEQFYILAPLLLYLAWKYARPYFSLIITGLILLGILTRLMLYGPGVDWLLDIRWPFHTRFDNLLSGVFAAYIFIKYNDWLRGLPGLVKWGFFLISLLTIGIALVFGRDFNSYFNTGWQFTLTGLGFAMLTLSMAISSFDSIVHPYLKKFFATTAKFSYTMYLYHIMLIYPVGNIVIRAHNYLGYRPSPAGFFLSFIIYFLVVLTVSGLIYQFVDRPAMSYRKKVLKK